MLLATLKSISLNVALNGGAGTGDQRHLYTGEKVRGRERDG